VISPDTFERPIYAGNAIETLQAPAGKKILTVRTTAFGGGPKAAALRSRKIAPHPIPALPNSPARACPNPSARN
jgi:electron transfer flavoprotein alpha subunit